MSVAKLRESALEQFTVLTTIRGHLARAGERHSADTLKEVSEELFRVIGELIDAKSEPMVEMVMRVLTVDSRGRPSLCEILYRPETFEPGIPGEQIVLEVPKAKISGDRLGRVPVLTEEARH